MAGNHILAQISELTFSAWPALMSLSLSGPNAKCRNVRFSNRSVRVKRFQTIHDCGVDIARGLVLLFGIGTKALVWGFLSQAG